MAVDTEGAELVSVDWSEVLNKTGATGKRKGLAEYKGKPVKLNNITDEKRGKKNVHFVMSADVESEGEESRAVIVPDRYASRVREYAKRRPGGYDGLQIEGVVEVSDKGSIMIRPVKKPEASQNGAVRRRGRPRRNPPASTNSPASQSGE